MPEQDEERVLEDLYQQPQLMMQLVEKSLLVAENLRDNYYRNTARFITHLRQAMDEANRGKRDSAILQTFSVKDATWEEFQSELVSFIDGGIGQSELSQVPILLRVGSYAVRVGEGNLAERENFGYYPVIFGDLEGGSKEREDFTDIVPYYCRTTGGAFSTEPQYRSKSTVVPWSTGLFNGRLCRSYTLY